MTAFQARRYDAAKVMEILFPSQTFNEDAFLYAFGYKHKNGKWFWAGGRFEFHRLDAKAKALKYMENLITSSDERLLRLAHSHAQHYAFFSSQGHMNEEDAEVPSSEIEEWAGDRVPVPNEWHQVASNEEGDDTEPNEGTQ